jgi:hypothetical protein
MIVGYTGTTSGVKFIQRPEYITGGFYRVETDDARIHFSYITDNGVKLVGNCKDLTIMAYTRRYEKMNIQPLSFNAGIGYSKVVVLSRFSTTFG